MPRYESFGNFLKNFSAHNYKSTFEDIEKILGEKLPPAAYDQDKFWSNKGLYVLMKEVRKAGWKQIKIDLYKREVEFERTNLTAFQKLQNYILNKIKPQTNYQLVMIKTLVRMGGRLTKDVLAEQIKLNNPDNPNQDYKQILVYEVLTKNEIVRQDGINYVLNGYHDFTDEQKREIVELCEQKIKEFSSKNVGENLDEVPKPNEDADIAKKFIDNQDFAKFLKAIPMISPFQSTRGRPPILAENYEILYRILYGTALDLDQVLKLKVRDLNLKNREISVVGTKSNDYPATILPCDVPHLQQHIAKLKENDLLFKVNRSNVWDYAKLAGIRAGLKISVEKVKKTRKVVNPSLFRESRIHQMWKDGSGEDLMNLKQRKRFTNTEYKDSLPTIEILKKWESDNYPFDYDELSSRPQQNVTQDKIIERKPVSEKLKIPTKEDLTKGVEIIQQELLIKTSVIHEIVAHLSSERHVLLAGPVGTGKTELAKLIPKTFWKEDCGYYGEVHTATADWSTQDVIGGIIPKTNKETQQPTYEIQYGCVSQTILDNYQDGFIRSTYVHNDNDKMKAYRGKWLVIDEFNRADIDKAFGQLFTAFEAQKLKILSREMNETFEEIPIPADYRIIGTLNTADKHFLFNLSDALKRRFAYVEISIPTRERKKEEIFLAVKNGLAELNKGTSGEILKELLEVSDNIITYKKEGLENKLKLAYDTLDLIRPFKPLGTAILKAIYQTIIVSEKMEISQSLDNALNANLIPQLESLEKTHLEFLDKIISGEIFTYLTKIDSPEIYKTSFELVLRYLEYSEEEIAITSQLFQSRDFEGMKSIFSERYTRITGETELKSLKDSRFAKSIHDLANKSEII